jgi:hypothetical protein
LLLSPVLTVPWLILRPPGMLFGMVFSGWPAVVFYTGHAAVQIVLGVGLLQLREGTRLGAIAYFALAVANMAVSMTGSGYARVMEQMRTSSPALFPPGDPLSLPAWPMVVLTALLFSVPIFFLVRRRPSFH